MKSPLKVEGRSHRARCPRPSKPKAEISYDKLEDVLYVSFASSPQKALGDKYGDFIVRSKKGKVVGVTILNASVHLKELTLKKRRAR